MRDVQTRPSNTIIVGVADLRVTNDPAAHVVTYSLGSCLGVTIYDPVARVGGMLHAMLPSFGTDEDKARENPAMFVDSGLSALFRAAYRFGAEKFRMAVKVAGGAELLVQDEFFGIGRRNYQTLIETLDRNGVVVSGCSVGGNISRTVRLELATGRVTIQAPGQSVIEI